MRGVREAVLEVKSTKTQGFGVNSIILFCLFLLEISYSLFIFHSLVSEPYRCIVPAL